MPVLARRRTTRILIAAAAAVPLVLAAGAAVISVLIGQSCSSGSGAGDAPSQVAHRDIPASFLKTYEQVGAQYQVPWEILAGIGEEECDHGRTPEPSCTPLPGATGPGVANCAGASGPMQIGVGGGPCGTAGDEYASLRRYLQNPALGPHDPMMARPCRARAGPRPAHPRCRNPPRGPEQALGLDEYHPWRDHRISQSFSGRYFDSIRRGSPPRGWRRRLGRPRARLQQRR